MFITKIKIISKRLLFIQFIIIEIGCKSIPTDYNTIGFNKAVDSNGIVTVGELKWQKCSAGQDPIKCTGEALSLNRESAHKYCRNLKLDNGGWNLPSIFELRELTKCDSGKLPSNIDKIFLTNKYTLGAGCNDENKLRLKLSMGTKNAKIDSTLFPNTISGNYWSGTNEQIKSEDYQQITNIYTSIDFENGEVNLVDDKDNNFHVRCVNL
jgi:hypothetical protein